LLISVSVDLTIVLDSFPGKEEVEEIYQKTVSLSRAQHVKIWKMQAADLNYSTLNNSFITDPEPLPDDEIHIDALIESILDFTVKKKAIYYEDLFNRFLLNVELSDRTTFYREVLNNVLTIFLNPFNTPLSSAQIKKMPYIDILQMESVVLPNVLPIFNDIEELNTRNLKRVFTRMMPFLLQIEFAIIEYKRVNMLRWGGEKALESAEVLQRLDSVSIAKLIHFFYTKHERKISFLKSKDSEVFKLCSIIEHFLVTYDNNTLESIDFRKKALVEDEKTYSTMYKTWETMRDLLLKLDIFDK